MALIPVHGKALLCCFFRCMRGWEVKDWVTGMWWWTVSRRQPEPSPPWWQITAYQAWLPSPVPFSTHLLRSSQQGEVQPPAKIFIHQWFFFLSNFISDHPHTLLYHQSISLLAFFFSNHLSFISVLLLFLRLRADKTAAGTGEGLVDLTIGGLWWLRESMVTLGGMVELVSLLTTHSPPTFPQETPVIHAISALHNVFASLHVSSVLYIVLIDSWMKPD